MKNKSGCSSMVEQQPSKLNTRVRFPSPAPMFSGACRPRSAISPISTQHLAADGLALDGVEFGHQLGKERCSIIVDQRYPALLLRFLVYYAHHVRAFHRAIVRTTLVP